MSKSAERIITLELLRKRSEHNEGLVSSLEELALHQEELQSIGKQKYSTEPMLTQDYKCFGPHCVFLKRPCYNQRLQLHCTTTMCYIAFY